MISGDDAAIAEVRRANGSIEAAEVKHAIVQRSKYAALRLQGPLEVAGCP